MKRFLDNVVIILVLVVVYLMFQSVNQSVQIRELETNQTLMIESMNKNTEMMNQVLELLKDAAEILKDHDAQLEHMMVE